MITPDLLKQAIESFPTAHDPIHCETSIIEQDMKLANEMMVSIGQCQEFHGMSAQLRETYFQQGMQIWAWVNIARVWMQIGYRLHSLELTESFKETT